MNFEEIKILFYFIIGHEYFLWFIYVLGIIAVTRDNIKTKKFISKQIIDIKTYGMIEIFRKLI